MSAKSTRLAGSIASLLLSTAGLAQSMNLDLGDVNGPPGSSYGAFAGQVGFWHTPVSQETENVGLKGLTGQAVAAVMGMSLPFGPVMPNHPDMFGGDKLLLDDILSMSSARGDLFFDGLEPGTYRIYSYCWDPGSTTNRTSVLVNLLDESFQSVGGAWPGELRQGEGCSVHTVTIAEREQLMMTYVKGTPSSRPLIGGMQLVKLEGIVLSLAKPLPDFAVAGVPTRVSVKREAFGSEPSGNPILHWRPRRSPALETFTAVVMEATEADEFAGDLPAWACNEAIEFYVEASAVSGPSGWLPAGAPASYLTIGVQDVVRRTLLAEGFEQGLPPSWAATGLWHVGSQCGGPAPEGSQFVGYNDELTCTFDTGIGNSGELATPAIDLTRVPPEATATMTFWARVVHENVFDYDEARILINGETLRVIQQAPEWTKYRIDLTPHIGASAVVTFQFTAIDELDNAYPGWLIDDVQAFWQMDACNIKCQPADIADDAGDPLPSAGVNSGVNEGDYNAMFQGFFDAAAYCDIADDAGDPLPSSGTNSGVNEGDYNCFFQNFFLGCP